LALESYAPDELATVLREMVELYQKNSKRVDKILKTSDHFQAMLLGLSEKLADIKDAQDKRISDMVSDQRQRAKQILHSRKSIYEAHKKEVYNYKININELTDLLNEKSALFTKYQTLQKDYEALKNTKAIALDTQSANTKELEYELDKLKEQNLEQELLALTKTLIQNELDCGFTDKTQFSKIFLKLIKSELENVFLTNHKSSIPLDKLSRFIIRRYLEDILSTAADIIIQSAVGKDKNAIEFMNYFNGTVIFNNNVNHIGRIEIIDTNGTKWIPSAIVQTFSKRNFLLKQIGAKKDAINILDIKLQGYYLEIKRLEGEIATIVPHHKQELSLINDSMVTTTHIDETLTADENTKVRFLKQLIMKNIQEANTQKRIISNETGKLLLFENSLETLSNTCDLIINAFVKALMT
jgi:hypothetical protein